MPPVIPPTTSPLGFFTPSPGALTPPSPLLADLIDPNTHEYISLFTGDDPIDAQVLIALKTVLGSGAAVTSIGSKLSSIRKITESTPGDVEAEVRNALAALIQQGDIRLVSVSVEAHAAGQIEAVVKYVNMRARDRSIREKRYTVPLPGAS